MPKVHKNKIQTQIRSITWTVNTKLCYLVKWVTKFLKDTTTKSSTRINHTEHLMFFVNKIVKVNKKEFLWTTNATAMHLNIKTEKMLEPLLISCETKLLKYAKNIPIKPLIRSLHILMEHNVFRFETTY